MKNFLLPTKPKIDFFFQNSVQFCSRAAQLRGGNIDISEVVDPAGFEPAISALQMRRFNQLSYRPENVPELNKFKHFNKLKIY